MVRFPKQPIVGMGNWVCGGPEGAFRSRSNMVADVDRSRYVVCCTGSVNEWGRQERRDGGEERANTEVHGRLSLVALASRQCVSLSDRKADMQDAKLSIIIHSQVLCSIR